MSILKTSILNVRGCQVHIRKSFHSYGIVISLLSLPAVLFMILYYLEADIATYISTLSPLSSRQEFAFYLDFVQMVSWEILWLAFFFLSATLLSVYFSGVNLDKLMTVKETSQTGYYVAIILTAFFATTVLIGFHTLDQFQNSSEEYAYIFQAQLFSDGKLWTRSHDLPDFFAYNHIVQHDGILVSQYPPGWPIFISVAFDIGVSPILVNPVLGLLALLLFYTFTRKFYGTQVALWSLVALAFSAYYIFNSASFFCHVLSLLITLLFVSNVYLFNTSRNFTYGLLAGFFLGFVLLVRYYTALFIFIPFLVFIIYQYRLRSVYLFLLMAIGSVPCLAFIFWYNYSITGDPFLPVDLWANPDEKLGFVNGHSFSQGVEHLFRRVFMFFYWCSPGLFILYFVLLWRKLRSAHERFLYPADYTFLLLMMGYFFYYQIGDNHYGPGFLFEAFPFLIVFVVNRVFETRQKWAMAFLVASLVYALVKFPFITYREGRIVEERKDLYNLVVQQEIRNAVIFVASPTSPIRPMPIADLTRNDGKFQNDVIYAHEIPPINDQLMEYYSDRSFYKYVREVNSPSGELIKIR